MTDDRSITVVAVGDVALGGEYITRACPPGSDLTYPFAAINDELRPADLVLVNLEGPIGTEGPKRSGRTALLHNHPDVLKWLASLPNCVCTLANNHTLDYGAEGLRRTIALLDHHGIAHLGAGFNAREAGRELRLTIGGMRIGLLAYTTDETHVGSVLAGPDSPGCCGLPDPDVIQARVRALAAETDATIVLLHWGYEYHHFPSPAQFATARAITQAGARIVIGHHPHVQQGIELANSSLICHSLGNLILPEMMGENGRVQYRKPLTKQYGILHAQIAPDRVAAWRITGGRCDRRYNLTPYSGRTANRFATTMDELSQPLKLTDYAAFWASYSLRRKRELEREGLRDAVAKFLSGDFKTICRTFSVADLRRNFRRLFSTARVSRGGPPADKANRAAAP